jgi:hypothetical protein
MTRPRGQEAEAHGGQHSEYRDRAACRARREHELEQRDGIADAVAEGTQWAVAVVGHDQHALAEQRCDR